MIVITLDTKQLVRLGFFITMVLPFKREFST